MKRRNFLTSFLALLPWPIFAKAKGSPKIEHLREDYYASSLALHRYREENGLTTGVRVRCSFRKTVLTGRIAPHGQRWHGNDSATVPVLLDKGYYQPWYLWDLTPINDRPEVPYCHCCGKTDSFGWFQDRETKAWTCEECHEERMRFAGYAEESSNRLERVSQRQ